jgi:hypothetical protein
MRLLPHGCLSVFVLALCPAARTAESTELDQFEDKCIIKAAERAVRAAKSDRVLWAKELEAAFPGKVADPTTLEEYGAWYTLLIGKNDEWRRADAPSAPIAALFDRAAQRLELGPVPAITRAEFLKYARHVLMRDQPKRGEVPDPNEDADKVFRTLDKDRDGELDREEMTAALKEERVLADSDGNGRISKTEYRAYFQRKVAARIKVLAAKDAPAGEKTAAKTDTRPAAKGAIALPDWFTTLDTDKDKQISLFEWRQAGRPVTEFQEMDLNGDGLLTAEEYLRWAKMKQIEADQQRREEGK